jgi:CII-binding regulator of phage lambda lysogenization HflD
MRYFIFTILLVVPLLLTAQSKKEQIATLNLRVDSLSDVLVNVRVNNAQTLSDKSEKIFQLSQEKGDVEKEKLETEKENDELLKSVHTLTENIVYMEAQLLELKDSLNNSIDSVNTLTENIVYMVAQLLEIEDSLNNSNDSVNTLTENIVYMGARLLELEDSLHNSNDSFNTLTENIVYMEVRLLELEDSLNNSSNNLYEYYDLISGLGQPFDFNFQYDFGINGNNPVRLFPIGWSIDGKFAYYEELCGACGCCESILVVQDLNEDSKVIYGQSYNLELQYEDDTNMMHLIYNDIWSLMEDYSIIPTGVGIFQSGIGPFQITSEEEDEVYSVLLETIASSESEGIDEYDEIYHFDSFLVGKVQSPVSTHGFFVLMDASLGFEKEGDYSVRFVPF